jgi:hypothetical protein
MLTLIQIIGRFRLLGQIGMVLPVHAASECVHFDTVAHICWLS